MPKLTPKGIIRKEYGESTNFMTPTVLDYGFLPRGGAWELSSGTGMDHEGIWGVSVVRENADGSTKRMTNISRLFRSKVTAKAYIDRLHRYLEEFGWPEGKFEPETTGE